MNIKNTQWFLSFRENICILLRVAFCATRAIQGMEATALLYNSEWESVSALEEFMVGEKGY